MQKRKKNPSWQNTYKQTGSIFYEYRISILKRGFFKIYTTYIWSKGGNISLFLFLWNELKVFLLSLTLLKQERERERKWDILDRGEERGSVLHYSCSDCFTLTHFRGKNSCSWSTRSTFFNCTKTELRRKKLYARHKLGFVLYSRTRCFTTKQLSIAIGSL